MNGLNKSAEKHKNIKGLELRLIVSEKRKLREVVRKSVRKRRKVPLYPYFHP